MSGLRSSFVAMAVLTACALSSGCSAEPAETEGDGISCEATAPASRTISCVRSLDLGEDAGFGEDEYPEIIYGEPEGGGTGKGSTDVLSLGRGGSIVVGFGGGSVADGPGPDFIVFENPFNIGDDPEHPFKELGEVSVSEDGVTWLTFPCAREAFPYEGCAGWRPVLAGSEPGIDAFDPEQAGGDPFDLATLGLTTARFVRITDISNAGGGGGTAGFDLDAVTVVHPAD
ncbi:MAG: hypothetical protein R3F14_09840 [Polyangiaceae bacterium]